MQNMGPYDILATAIYGVLILLAVLGAYQIVMTWWRVAQKRFRNEEAQIEFLAALQEPLGKGDFNSAGTMCEGDRRAICQLASLAITNRSLGFAKVRQLVMDRFQQDVLGDIEARLSWVNTYIKSAPMVGLLGTVLGMMGAFGKLATQENVKPDQLASDINVALITTASGLAIAIPLVLCVTLINVRIRKMEDLCAMGLTQFLENLRSALTRGGK